jgi:hypothetical protein
MSFIVRLYGAPLTTDHLRPPLTQSLPPRGPHRRPTPPRPMSWSPQQMSIVVPYRSFPHHRRAPSPVSLPPLQPQSGLPTLPAYSLTRFPTTHTTGLPGSTAIATGSPAPRFKWAASPCSWARGGWAGQIRPFGTVGFLIFPVF